MRLRKTILRIMRKHIPKLKLSVTKVYYLQAQLLNREYIFMKKFLCDDIMYLHNSECKKSIRKIRADLQGESFRNEFGESLIRTDDMYNVFREHIECLDNVKKNKDCIQTNLVVREKEESSHA